MTPLQEEESIHAAAIGWLAAHRGYEQILEDPDEATNARLDSVGLMAGSPSWRRAPADSFTGAWAAMC